MSLISSKRKKKLVPHTRGHVLGQDYSGYARTNASSECTFSALRRVKSYFRITMLNCLNHLMTCIVHKNLVNELNLRQITNDVVDRVERRSSIFGHFST